MLVNLRKNTVLSTIAIGTLSMFVFTVHAIQNDRAINSLPPLPDRLQDESGLLSVGKFFVKDYHFDGNAVYSDEELSAVVDSFRNRAITAEELQQIPALLTRHYVHDGYVNSGALIPDQNVSAGTITIQIIEGWVSRIEMDGNHELHTDYLTPRFQTANPFNIQSLEQKIQLLQRNPVIQKINANLGAGHEKGEGVLRVAVEEKRPYEAGIGIDNRRSPSVGSERGEIWALHHSLTGWNDPLEVRYSVNQGPDDYQVAYSRPVSANDAVVAFAYEQSKSLVLEAPFNELDIESQFTRYYLAYRYPFINALNRNLNLSIDLEHRRAETSLLGQPFSFSSGVIDGKSRVTALHFVQEWLGRTQSEILSLRSDFKFGVDWFDATINDSLPDSEFVVWLGQTQWIKRLDSLESTMYMRAFVQRANTSLLPEDKVNIGGMETVRGYRESSLLRDQAVILSAEWRIPVDQLISVLDSNESGNSSLELALFYDYGEGRNKSFSTQKPECISSVGFGVLWQPTENISATVYMGFNLDDVAEPSEYDLQDDGIHFQFGMKLI